MRLAVYNTASGGVFRNWYFQGHVESIGNNKKMPQAIMLHRTMLTLLNNEK